MKNINLNELTLKDAEFSVLDFETTGTSAAFSRVIEIGIVKIKRLKIVDSFQSFINPEQEIPFQITELTGITNSVVSDAPKFDSIINQINGIIGESILTAHNLRFDYSFLKTEFERAEVELIDYPTLCTLKIARKLYPELKSKALGSLVKHFRIRHKNVHRALGDATVTAKLLLRMIKKLREEYHIETASELINFQSMPGKSSSFRIMKKKLAEDFAALPDSPGIYYFKDSKDSIIYIGKAKSIKSRVKNYFSSNAPRKSKQIIRKASRLSFETTNSELTALLTEAQLIKIHNPAFNSMLKKYPQQFYINVKLIHEFPDISISNQFDFDGNDYFGPYNNRDTANNLVEIINKTYQLRECSDKEISKHKKCYLTDIKRCLAPCIYENVQEIYMDELNNVYEFLSGQNQSAVNRLLSKMKEHAEKQKYEDAAEVRDVINIVLNQLNKSSIIAEPINKANVLFVVNGSVEKDFLLLLEGKVFIRNYFLDEKDIFDKALEGYYDGTIHLFPEIQNKDLEQLKITLSWLVKNRNAVKIFYLKDYNSREELDLSYDVLKGSFTEKDLIEIKSS